MVQMVADGPSAEGAAAPLLWGKEELQELRDSVRRVLTAHCGSRAIHQFIDGNSPLSETLWRQAADLGWLAAALPEDYGGLGLGPQGLHVLHSELGRRAAPGPFIATLALGQWLVDFGDADLQKAWLPRIAAGEISAAVPATPGSEPGLNLSDGLHGSLPVLGSAGADLILAPVRMEGRNAAWALLAPAAGKVSLERSEIWDRTRELCKLSCVGAQAVRLIEDDSGDAGRSLARHMALAVASDSIGGAASISEQTIEYLKGRVQFDRPVGSFQALKHRAADLVTSIATQEHLLQQGVESAAQMTPDADMWAALAKAGATDAFTFVSGDCIQLHGGVGHTWEFDAHVFAKRARLNEMLVASNRAQRDFAARALADATRAGRITTELEI